jgi:hypothetical protein
MVYREAPPASLPEKILSAWLARPSALRLQAPVSRSEQEVAARLLRERQSVPGEQLLWLWLVGLSLVSPPLWLFIWLVSRLPEVIAERLSFGVSVLLFFFLGELLWYSGRVWFAQRTLSQEERWLRSLPVPVAGYFDLLQVEAVPGRAFALRLFLRNKPRLDLVSSLVERFSSRTALLSFSSDGRVLELQPTKYLDNAAARRWLRGALQEVVVPLHHAYPVSLARIIDA